MLAAAVLQVYLVAEDKVLKVTPPNVRAAKPASEVFFSYNATPGRSQEIVGLSVAGGYSSLFLTIRNLGLFVFSLEGDLQWSLGPVLDWFGYRLGCKGNISVCYFDSAPVLDHTGGALYVRFTLIHLCLRFPQFCLPLYVLARVFINSVLADIEH